MFWRKRENALESEVAFLRGMVKDLTDRLMAVTGEAHARFHAEKRTEEALAKPSTEETILSKINGMEAVGDDERRQKAEAMDFAQAIIGGGSHG